MDVCVHVGCLHAIDDRLPLGAKLGVRQPSHGQVGHLAVQTVLALERCLADDPVELHAQFIQDRLGVERQEALTACAVNERL
eukprot:7019273-Alexandrium_andersonii.AAC.1